MYRMDPQNCNPHFLPLPGSSKAFQRLAMRPDCPDDVLICQQSIRKVIKAMSHWITRCWTAQHRQASSHLGLNSLLSLSLFLSLSPSYSLISLPPSFSIILSVLPSLSLFLFLFHSVSHSLTSFLLSIYPITSSLHTFFSFILLSLLNASFPNGSSLSIPLTSSLLFIHFLSLSVYF